MKRSHVRLLIALMFIVSVSAGSVFVAEAGIHYKTGDDVVGVLDDDSGVAPHQGEPDVGQTNDNPGQAEPGIGNLRLISPSMTEGLMSWTSAFWVTRLFGIGI